jgi:hypothetical protein
MGSPSDTLSDAIKILDSEPAKNLLSPLTKEVGEFLGDVGNLARFYATENLAKIFGRWARSRGVGRTLSDGELRKVMPLLPLASMVSDDELQGKWAALMERTAKDDGCLPSFGQTLAQLTAEQVRYLDRLWKVVSAATDRLSVAEPLSYIGLVQVFDPGINAGVSPAEWKLFKKRFTDKQKTNYERLDRAKLVIDDLIRLGIIREDRRTEAPPFLEADDDEKIPLKMVLTSRYSVSQYGASFMQAVTASCDGGTADTAKQGDQ